MIRIRNGNFLIDGKETFLYGGEFHYFRVPKSNWRDILRQLKDAGMNLVSTYIPWKFHEAKEGEIDLTGETLPEKDLKSFLDLVKEEGMYCLVRPGPYVMAEIIDHGVPSWFIDNYPEARAKTKDGQDHPSRIVSYLHPVYLEKVEKWYNEVCLIVKNYQKSVNGPIILFQLDNEVGMFHWVTNTPDFNTVTLQQFARYLKNRYTPGQFEKTFRYPYEKLEEFVKVVVPNPDGHHADAIRNEYSLFMREHYRNYLEYLKSLAEKNGIEVPFVVNVHGFHTVDLLKRGTMYPIGLSQLLEAAKIENTVLAGDYYIGNIEYDNYIDIVLANAFTRSIQWKEQPLFSAEFQGGCISDRPKLQPTTFDLTTRLCIADGMNGVNFYMFVGGENYENIGIHGRRHDWQAPLTSDGKKRPHYEKIQHLGKMLNVYGHYLSDTKPEVDLYLGFYPDYYMTDYQDVHTEPVMKTIQDERERFMHDGIARGLRLKNYIFDACNLLEDGDINPQKVKHLFVFSTKWMDQDIQEKLFRYVENGGCLVLFPTIPEMTMKNEPCTLLKDYIGVAIEGYKYNGFAKVNDLDNIKYNRVEIYRNVDGVFAWTEDGNEPVAFSKQSRKGKLIVFGLATEFDFNYKFEIIGYLTKMAQISKRFELEEEIDITVRTHEDGRMFFFLTNFDEYPKLTSIRYKGNKLFGGKKISIPPRTGLILPFNMPIYDDLQIVSSTCEIIDITHDHNQLQLTLKLAQEHEEIEFISNCWFPKRDENTFSVKNFENNRFTINIHSRNSIEQIVLTKR